MCTFSSTASLSANQRPCAEPADSTVISSTMRSATSKSPAIRRSSAASNSDGLHLGEVAHLPDVHAEHGDTGLVRGVDRRAAWCRRRRARSRRRGRRCRGRSPPARRSGTAPRCRARRVVPTPAPRGRAAVSRSGCGTRPTGAADAHGGAASVARHHVVEADVVERGTAARRSAPGTRRCRRRPATATPSRRPRGDRRRVEPVAHLVEHGPVDRGIAYHSPLADAGAARPRTAASPAARGRPSASVHRASAGATVSSEMNERSATVRSTGPPRASGSRWRTLVRSRTVTRGSSRSDHASWPRPTSTASTCTAPGLEQAVGEPAGGGAGVEGAAAPRRRREAVERAGELLAARGTRSGADRR